jgi:hypothetical protein
MDAIGGVTLDMLAEITTKQGTLQTQFGAGARQKIAEYLATLGLTENSFAEAHNAWLTRMRSDPTGQLEADYHMRVARLANKAHFGDVRDMSGDTQEGVTLDRYAALCVAMAKPGVDAEAVARANGLTDAAHWVRVNAAWTQAMSQDTTMKLTSQFGELYSKHAGPAFDQSMRDQTAAILASGRNEPQPQVDAAPPREETVDELLAKLSAPALKDRFKAARWLAHRWDIGHAADPSLDRVLVCIPVLIEALERHSEDEASMAEDAARKLMDLGQRNDEVRGAMQRCLNRADEQLATLHRAFDPIADKAVPERIPLRGKIDAYESLIRELRGILSEWSPAAAAAAAPAGLAGTAAASVSGAGRSKSGPGMAIGIAVAVVVAIAGGIAFLRSRAEPMTSEPPAAASASATAAAVVPKAPAASAAAPPVAPAAAATASAHGAKKAK